jgi:hypothetical protein
MKELEAALIARDTEIATLRDQLAAAEKRAEEAERDATDAMNHATEAMRGFDTICDSAKELAEMLREHWKAPGETDALTLYAASIIAGFATAWKDKPPANGTLHHLVFPEIGTVELCVRKIDGKPASKVIQELQEQLVAAERALDAARGNTAGGDSGDSRDKGAL